MQKYFLFLIYIIPESEEKNKIKKWINTKSVKSKVESRKLRRIKRLVFL
jgi:hypothetical protein